MAVGVGVGGGVGVEVAVGVGGGVGVAVAVEVGVGPGCVGVGVGWRFLLGWMRTIASQRAWPRGTAPHTCLNEYPTPILVRPAATGAAGVAEAAPAPPARTSVVTQRETMLTSVARMRTRRRMPDNPSCAHADDSWHGIARQTRRGRREGHATQALSNSLARSRSKEIPGLDIWNGQAGAEGSRSGARQSQRGVSPGCVSERTNKRGMP